MRKFSIIKHVKAIYLFVPIEMVVFQLVLMNQHQQETEDS